MVVTEGNCLNSKSLWEIVQTKYHATKLNKFLTSHRKSSINIILIKDVSNVKCYLSLIMLQMLYSLPVLHKTNMINRKGT